MRPRLLSEPKTQEMGSNRRRGKRPKKPANKLAKHVPWLKKFAVRQPKNAKPNCISGKLSPCKPAQKSSITVTPTPTPAVQPAASTRSSKWKPPPRHFAARQRHQATKPPAPKALPVR